MKMREEDETEKGYEHWHVQERYAVLAAAEPETNKLCEE
jgi:hypothetical protein